MGFTLLDSSGSAPVTPVDQPISGGGFTLIDPVTPPITPDMPVVGEFQGKPEDVKKEIDAMTDPMMKGLAQKAFDQQFGGTPAPVAPVVPTPPVTPLGTQALNIVKDIPSAAVGAAQGVGSVLGGVGAFMLGIPASLPSILEGLPGSGEPASLKRGLAAAKDKQDKIMETLTYQPSNKYGQALAELVALPFSEAHKGIAGTVEALGGDEETTKAFQYLFDVALFGLPMLKGKKGETRLPTKEEWDTASTEALEEIKKSGPKEIGGVKTEDVIGEAVGKLRQGTKDVPLSEVSAKYEGNQSYVDALRDEASARSGYSKGAYERAAIAIEQMTEPLTKEQLSVIAKDPKAKTRVFVEGLLPKPEAKPPVEKAAEFSFSEISPKEDAAHVAPLNKSNPPNDAKFLGRDSEGRYIYEDKDRNIYKLDNKLEIDSQLPTSTEEVRRLATEQIKDKVSMEELVKGTPELRPEVKAQLENVYPEGAKSLIEAEDGSKKRKENFDKFMEKTAIRNAMESQGQGILDLMDEKGESPANVADTFWKDTYFKLDSQTQTKARQLLKGYHLDALPENVMEFLDLPDNVEYLEGTERGFVAFMKYANDKIKDEAKSADLIEAANKVSVAPDVENKVPVFNSIEEVTGFKVMSEVPENVAKADMFREPDSEFKTVQVGDKFYRMEKDTPIEKFSKRNEPNLFDQFDETKVDKFDEEYEPSESDLKVEELGIRKLIEEENASTTPPERRAEIRPEIAEAYERYKQRSVAKFNKAKPPETQIKKSEDLTPVKEEFATFSDLAEAEAWAKAKGIEGEPIQDPLTKRWFFEPELKELDDYSWETGLEDIEEVRRFEEGGVDGYGDSGEYLSDRGTMSLVDIFNNERGAVDITHLRILADRLREIQRTSKEMGKTVEEMLASVGMTPEAIEKVMLQMAKLPEHDKEIRRVDPIVERIFNPESPVISQTIKSTKKKGMTQTVPITVAIAERLAKIPRDGWGRKVRRVTDKGEELITFEKGAFGKFMEVTEIPLRAFERFGMEDIWYDWVAQERKRRDWLKKEQKEVKVKIKDFTAKELYEVALAAEADQAGGRDILTGMGINNIPLLNAKQRSLVDWFRERFDTQHDQINYSRTHTGQYAMPYVQNYFPRMRQLNILKKLGVIDNLTSLTPERAKTLMDEFKSNFNPHAQKRVKAKDLPVELDIVKGYLRYIDYASNDIFIAPVAALAKEMAKARIPKGEGKRGKVYFVSKNPEAAHLLDRWSGEIMGKDPAAGLYAEYPWLKATSNYIHRNLIAGTILGTVSTVLKQTGAYTGTLAEVGPWYLSKGIAQYMYEKPLSRLKGTLTKAKEKSNILNIRRSDLYFEKLHELYINKDLTEFGNAVRQLAATPMNIMDAIVAETSWNAFYDYAINGRKMSPEAAFKFAEQKTAYTQAVGVKGAVAPLQNIPIVSLAFVFQTFAINDFNYVARDILGIKNPNPKDFNHFRKVARYMIGAYLINSAFHLANTDPPHPQPIETYLKSVDEGDSELKASVDAFIDVFEKVPGIGGAIKYDASLFGAVGELANDLPTAAKYAIAMIDWDNLSEAQRWRNALFIGHVIGRTWGIPFSNQMKKSIRAGLRGGSTWEVVVGAYVEERRKQGLSSPPGLSSSLPGL